MRNAVVLPEGESEDEWIAFNIWNFNKQINMLYGTVLSSCTMEKCPVMNAGRCYIYNWSDGKSKPKSLPGISLDGDVWPRWSGTSVREPPRTGTSEDVLSK